jgi:tetratricopeptide (TPR) repeat protein
MPVTIGLSAPRILLPRGWSDWPGDKITAVLAHEAAHVRRRDTVTSFLAHLNRVLFWFHPLAWWLQRRLALDAEQACDDAGVIALGEIHRYTEVLVDIAQAVSRSGGTFTFHGAGVDGAGLLGPRIDRLLHGLPSVRETNGQKAALAISCGMAIFLAAACQQKPLPALKADLGFAERIAGSIARNNRFQEINQMTAADAEGLEAKVLQNLDDADAREKLMTFYQSKGRQVLGDDKTTKGFWTIKLWCIEHHPEDPCASLIEPLFDPASYQKGAKLWDSILRRPNVTPDLQVAAATYFRRADPKRAEEIAKRARIDEQRRTHLLSGIYAFALSGPSSETPYAEDLRQRLDQSTDAALLSTTGFSLSLGQPRDSAASMLGHKYIDRAAALDPASVNRDDLKRMEHNQASGQVFRQMRALVGDQVTETQYQKASVLPPVERALVLPNLAERAYWAGANLADYNHDPNGAHKDWDLARKYAKDALIVEENFRSDPDYANRVYKADIILAMVAVRADGNHTEAIKYLRTAAPIKTDDNWFPATLKLLVVLLRYGNAEDRAAVIEFCEIRGKAAPPPGIDLIQSAQKLRQGVMPTWYQFEVTQFKR